VYDVEAAKAREADNWDPNIPALAIVVAALFKEPIVLMSPSEKAKRVGMLLFSKKCGLNT
jgi:hypothetical protein